MSQPFFSIIIPIYQVEDYLHQCVSSVLEQSFSDLELILVDDGSPDNCGTICDAFALQDPRVKVIHKANGGLSDARNAGMALAGGEYVLFLDGDDWWADENALDRLARRLQLTGADVLNFSYRKVDDTTGSAAPYLPGVPDMRVFPEFDDQLRYLLHHKLYISPAWNKAIRRQLLSGLSFPLGVYSEDIAWSARLLLRARSMDFVNEEFYAYRQRSGSITHLLSDKRCIDLADAVCTCRDLCRGAEGTRGQLLQYYTAFQLGTFILNQALAENRQTDAIARLEPHADILIHHGGNQKLLCLHLACRALGFRRLCALVRTIYQKKQQRG